MKSLVQIFRAARQIVTHARSSSELFKLIRPGEVQVLNMLPEGASPVVQSADDILGMLATLRRQLRAEAYITDEARVDYARLASSPALAVLATTTQALHHVTRQDVDDEVMRKALFINLYNVLMIHSVIALKIERTVMEVPSIFSSVGYQVGPHIWTLDAMEHGVLRANSPHPTSRTRVFAQGDARLEWMVPRDARIHAALVCAANSCPPIRLYEASALDEQLDLASESFVQGSTRVDHDTRTVYTSAIFEWYASDFDVEGGVSAFMRRHSTGELAAELSRALEMGYTWRSTPYDWSLNGL